MKCMMSCVRNLLSRPSNTPSSPWRCYRLCWRLRAGADGRLAALVERAASHGVAPSSVIDAATGAKDIALY